MSDPTTYLAVDLGASSGRAVLGVLEGNVMQMEEVHRFETPVVEEGGHLFWDLDALWEEVRTALRLCLQETARLRSVSVDSWAVDYVPLDRTGRALRDPYCYRDRRTEGMMRRAFEAVPAAEIYATTGIQFLPFNTLYQVLSDLEGDPDIVRRTSCHLTIADYIHYRLSARSVIEESMASTTQMMNVRTRSWSEPLMKTFGIDPSRWPEIVPSGTRLGPVSFAADVEVVASCSHDTGCAVAAVPAVNGSASGVAASTPEHSRESWAFISCGTWSLLGTERREPILSEAARRAGFTNEAGVDGTVRFLKNLTGLWVLQECAREWGDLDWAVLEEEARSAGSLCVDIDLEDPRFLPQGAMEARLVGYLQERGTPVPQNRASLTRTILESIAASYRRAIEDLETVTDEMIETIHLVGGGSRNRLLCELTAEATGREIFAGPAEATALGNLLIQARTMGDLPEEVTIRDLAARSSEVHAFTPNHQTV